MSELNDKVVPVDVVAWQNNRRDVPVEVLLPHAERQVAWNGDGTSTLASGDDDEDVLKQLERLGIRPEQVVFDFITFESCLGGGLGGEYVEVRRDATGRYRP